MPINLRFALIPLLLLMLAACQPTVYLMPTPEAFRAGELDPFDTTRETDRSNKLLVAYATNRLPLGNRDSLTYTTLFDQSLRLGVAQVRIGSEAKTWEELYRVSTTAERELGIPLTLEAAAKMAVIDAEADLDDLPPPAREFFDRLNKFLAESQDNNLTLYVHGANNNFYRATAQAAQYRHFTGRHSAVMVFAWPSAESLFRYAVDVSNARRSVPVFVRLLELLARHSDARYINILAYSAGAQLVSPGLKTIREAHADEPIAELRERLRIGEVYFAAPDVEFKSFVEQLPVYIGLVRNVSLSANVDDTVLALAASHHGASRAGSPDPNELTEEQTEWLIAASRQPHFDLIKVDPEVIPELGGGAHDFWYANPWVSTDVLVQMIYHARPAERGLATFETRHGEDIWGFPQDYPERVIGAVRRLENP